MTADPLEIVAPDLVRIPLGPRDCLNAYLLGDLLVDSGARFNARKLLATLAERPVAAHALTHAHMDHQGSSAAICERLEVPLWCGAGDREAAESGDLSGIVPDPRSPMARLGQRLAGPGHPVARVLREGEAVGGFTVLAAPGHTPGHLAFWRESDRTLVLGDVLFNMNLMTLRPGLREPFRAATFDVPANRDSARRLAALAPQLICFGHGPPLRDGARFRRFVRALGLRLPESELALIVPVVSLMSLPPLTINDLGLREGSFALLGASIGLRASDAVALGWLLVIPALLYRLLRGVIYVRGRRT